jgi:GGDEF domain-containing protein
MAVIALCMGTMVHQSLYDGRRAAALRTVTVSAAYLLTIALSAAAAQRGLHPNSGIVVGNLPGIVGAGAVMRVLRVALTSHELTTARDAVLARTATALLGVTDRAAIRRIAGEAGAELCAVQPGVGVLVLRIDPDRVVVENSNGVLRPVRGAVLPLACATALDPAANGIVPLTATADFDRLAGRRMHWSAMHLSAPDVQRYLLIASPTRIASDVLAAHRVLAAQVSMAEDGAVAHARLLHQANHDALTGLANRASLYRLLAETIESGADADAGAAVLHVDLDDFKAVNDTYGHTAGDELLVEVARRLREVARPDGCAARIGGDEFVLLLPAVRDAGAAERTAARLLAALDAPVAVG